MLADLMRDDWLGILGLGPEEAPAALIMRGTRNLKTRLAQHRELLADAHELGSPNGIFEDILLGSYRGVRLAMACVYGAPMASEIAHVFGVIGVSRIVLTGCCGALQRGLAAGDIVVPSAAFPGDGASGYYGADASVLVPADPLLHAKAVALLGQCGWAAHPGRIYTTSALCAESAADVADWSGQGYAAVDMETATAYAVASHFRVPAVAMLFAFDCLAAGESIVLTDAEKAQRRERGEQVMMAAALELAVSDGKEQVR